MKTALRSTNVLTPSGIRKATVVIENGVITDIADHIAVTDCEIVDYGSLVLMPGLTDTHVHINEPGRTEWEGFETATMAAAAGGITMLVDMPLNSSPVTTNPLNFKKKIQAADNKLFVDCGFYGGVIPSNTEVLADLIKCGVFGLKAFMVDSGIEEFPCVNENDLRRALEKIKRYEIPLLVHAEVDCGTKRAENYNECSFNSFLETRPKDWENKAIEILIKLSKEFDHHIHIVHLTSSDAIEMIKKAKSDGLKITTETCPHYLYFSSEEIPDGDTRYKCTPPIRDNDNREKLWKAVEDGVIDLIVSDHSPCEPSIKCIEEGNFEKAWGGISGLQLGLSVIWTEAKKRGLGLDLVSKVMCNNTASFIGLTGKKGMISKGFDADLVVFSPDRRFKVDGKKLFHKHKITPYNGKEFYGIVEATYLRGEMIFCNDEFINGPSGKIIYEKKYG